MFACCTGKGGEGMLKNWNKPEKPDAEELDARLEAARQKLREQQMLIKERKLPVLV